MFYSAVGIATVSGSLTVTTGELFSAVGVATVTGTLTAAAPAKECAGSPAGISTVTATLVCEPVGVTAGTSTVTGTLLVEGTKELAGAVTGTSTVTGFLLEESVIGIEALDSWERNLGVWERTDLAFVMRICYLPGGPRGVTRVVGGLASVTSGVSIGGFATVTGVLAEPYAGTPAGSSTVSGTLASELVGSSAGVSTVTGAPVLVYQLAVVSAGTSTVVGEIALNNPGATTAGVATVTGYLLLTGVGLEAGYEIPYPFLGDGSAFNEATGVSVGFAEVTATLDVEVNTVGVSEGTSTVTADLFTEAGTGWLAGVSDGSSTVTGFLLNRPDLNIAELVGVVAGMATVAGVLWNATWIPASVYQQRFLYLLCNIGVSFDPTDDDSGDARFVSQTFEDGEVWEFNRYLYLLGNIGVSFDPTDDDSADPRFVSQTFEDGDTWEFDRCLYLLANILEEVPVEHGNLTINEGYRGQETALPKRTPPSRRF